MSQSDVARLTKRFIPLYCAAFFQGFVLWYSFEKIFMRQIGFSDTGIGLVVAIYSAVMLLAETPSGIMADRWSRKGVLIIASVAIALCSLIGGYSYSIGPYIIASMLWGIYFALYTGTYDSIVYDTIHEELGRSKTFDTFYGRIRMYDSFALVVSSLLSGVLVNYLGLRAAYFLTIPFSLLAVISLLWFKEPLLHKLKVAIPIKQQIKATFVAVTRNKTIWPVVSALVMLSLLTYIALEFTQVWYIALQAPLSFYGPANAFLLLSLGLGGVVVSRYKLYSFSFVIYATGLMLITSLGLVFVKNSYIITLCFFVLITIFIAFTVIFNRILHNSLEPNIRAGASSAISTIGRVLIIPVAILMGYISREFTIFKAAWIVVISVLLLSVLIVIEAQKNERRGLEPK